MFGIQGWPRILRPPTSECTKVSAPRDPEDQSVPARPLDPRNTLLREACEPSARSAGSERGFWVDLVMANLICRVERHVPIVPCRGVILYAAVRRRGFFGIEGEV